MIKKLCLILLIPIISFAQDQKNTSQNIELPEFVITGVERVSLSAAIKPKAELIPVLSEDFFKPSYPPEQLHLAAISNPAKKSIDLFTKAPDFKGRLQIGAGTVSLPTGLLSFGTSYKTGTFFGKIYGSNLKDDEDYVGLNNSGVELNNTLFINSTSTFLPGARFDLGGSYYRESYKFRVLNSLNRHLHFGEIHLNTAFMQEESFKFNINISDRPLYIKDLKFTENTFETDVYAEGGVRNFQLIGQLKFIGQKTDEVLSERIGYNYISPSAYLRLKNTDDYKLEFGFNFTSFNSKNIFQPHVFAGLNLSSKFSIFGEYKPQAKLMTNYDILKMNRYFAAGSVDNFLVEEKTAFKIALRYEYETFFEIDGGFRFSEFKHFPYFADLSDGKFNVKSMEARRFTGFLNMLFHLGPFGVFYGDVILEEFRKDKAPGELMKHFVPYQPVFRSNLNYGYTFPFGFKTEGRLFYASDSYSDTLNTEATKIPAFLDLSLHLSFELFKNFDLFTEINNLFDNKNYYWKGYKEKPLDMIIGIDYRW